MIWFNGDYVQGDSIELSAHAAGFTLGNGIFETIRGKDGQPLFLEAHLRRLNHGAKVFGLDYQLEGVEVVLKRLMVENRLFDAKLRITVYKVGAGLAQVVITAQPLPDMKPEMTVISMPLVRNEHSPLVGVKSTSYGEYSVALARARLRDADEAILGNTQGNLCEGSFTNVFVRLRGERTWLTPPLGAGPLPGITRNLVLESAQEIGLSIEQVDVAMHRLTDVEAMFLTSSLRGAVEVVSIDDRGLIGGGRDVVEINESLKSRYTDEVGKL